MTSPLEYCVAHGAFDWHMLAEHEHEGRIRTWQEESTALTRFRDLREERWNRVVHTDPCERLSEHTHRGAPDFLIERPNGVLGIEITTLTIPERAQKADLRRQILERATNEYRERQAAPPCEVYLNFHPRLALHRTSPEEVADELVAIAERLAPDATMKEPRQFELDDIYQQQRLRRMGKPHDGFVADLSAVKAGVATISVIRYPGIEKTKFMAGAAAWVPEWGDEKLEDRLSGVTKHAV